MHNESRGPGIWQLIVSQPPGHFQTTKNVLRNILSSFPTVLRVKGFKHHHFGIKEHLSTIKLLQQQKKNICFVVVQSEGLILWPILCCSIKLKQLCLLKVASNIFVYWLDGLGAGYLTIVVGMGGQGICQQKLPAGPGIWQIFQVLWVCPEVCRGDARGWNWLAHYSNKCVRRDKTRQNFIHISPILIHSYFYNLYLDLQYIVTH